MGLRVSLIVGAPSASTVREPMVHETIEQEKNQWKYRKTIPYGETQEFDFYHHHGIRKAKLRVQGATTLNKRR